jgi:hypothetical protein
MDFAQHLEEQFQWLLTMARAPGFKEHAWRRAKDLAASNRMYESFPQRLVDAMKGQSNEDADRSRD